MRGALAERTPHEGQRECLRLERFRRTATQAVPQHCHECLRARVDAPTLLSESQDPAAAAHERLRHHLAQPRFFEREHETRIAAFDRMADAITFASIEEQD